MFGIEHRVYAAKIIMGRMLQRLKFATRARNVTIEAATPAKLFICL